MDEKSIKKVNRAIWGAAAIGSVKYIKELVDQGADIHQVNEKGATPMIFSVGKGKLDAVKYFVENGVSVNPEDGRRHALHEAAKQGHIDIVDYLIKQGADIDALNWDGKTVFEVATPEATEFIKSIIEKRSLDEMVKQGGELTSGISF